MSKNPVSKSKPVKGNEPLRAALKFFAAGCVAELYLLLIRRFYVNGTVDQLLACDEAPALSDGCRRRRGRGRPDPGSPLAAERRAAAGPAGPCAPPACSWAAPPG